MSICAVNRGNCPEICVPTPNNIAFCKCQLHEMYSNFDNMCHAGSIPGELFASTDDPKEVIAPPPPKRVVFSNPHIAR